MSNVIFDASTLLALINKEEGSKIAEKFLGDIIMSSVNVSEAAGKLLDLGMDENECREIIESLVSKIIDFDSDLSFLAASLKNQTKHKGLSLGDRACIATGIKYGLEIYTADKVWLDCGIQAAKIKLIR